MRHPLRTQVRHRTSTSATLSVSPQTPTTTHHINFIILGQQKRPTKMQSNVSKQQMQRASKWPQKVSKSMHVGTPRLGATTCGRCHRRKLQITKKQKNAEQRKRNTERRAKNRTRAGRPKRTQEKEKKNTRASRSEQNEHEQRQQEHKPAGLSRTMLSPRAEQEQQKHNKKRQGQKSPDT